MQLFLVPSMLRSVRSCSGEVKTTEICVSWMQPDGGDAVDEYLLNWKSINNLSPQSNAVVDVISSFITYNYTITSVQPGETINVTIAARNSAGSGPPSASATFTTSKSVCFYTRVILGRFLINCSFSLSLYFVKWNKPKLVENRASEKMT